MAVLLTPKQNLVIRRYIMDNGRALLFIIIIISETFKMILLTLSCLGNWNRIEKESIRNILYRWCYFLPLASCKKYTMQAC